MARPIWKGNITFGLVNIPITLYAAEKRSEIHFNLIDNRNRARVRYDRVNEVTGEEVPWDQIVKAYEYKDGEYITLDDQDFKRASVERTQTIDIEDFVDQKAIQYTFFDKPYYVIPGAKGDKGYVLLRETLKRTGQTGIAKVVIHTREYLAALFPQDSGLVLGLLRFANELRKLDEFDLPGDSLKAYNVNERELKMAEQLVQAMHTEWTPEKYKDDYRDALLRWIETKAKAGEAAAVAQAPEEKAPEPTEIVDFIEQMKKSLERKKKAAQEAAKPAPPKKRAGGGRHK